jgi:hypothetical protein
LADKVRYPTTTKKYRFEAGRWGLFLEFFSGNSFPENPREKKGKPGKVQV